MGSFQRYLHPSPILLEGAWELELKVTLSPHLSPNKKEKLSKWWTTLQIKIFVKEYQNEVILMDYVRNKLSQSDLSVSSKGTLYTCEQNCAENKWVF